MRSAAGEDAPARSAAVSAEGPLPRLPCARRQSPVRPLLLFTTLVIAVARWRLSDRKGTGERPRISITGVIRIRSTRSRRGGKLHLRQRTNTQSLVAHSSADFDR